MYFFTKIFIGLAYFIIFIIFIILLILCVKQGYLNQPIQSLFELYLNQKGLSAEIRGLHIKNRTLLIDKTSLKLKNKDFSNKTRVELTDIKIKFNIDTIINKKSLILVNIDVSDFTLIAEDNKEILSTKIQGDYKLNLFKNKIEAKIQLNSIKSPALSNLYITDLLSGSGSYTYHNKIIGENKTSGIELNFGDKFNIELSSTLKDTRLKAHGKMSNIPIMLYKTVIQIIPNNKMISFLEEYIKSGYIKSGEFNLDLNSNFLEQDVLTTENLNGKFHITDLEYKYDKDFPPLRETEMDVIMSGNEVKFLLNKAYSGNSLISNGLITLNWTGTETSNVTFNAISKGLIKDFIDFIPVKVYEDIKNRGIDLKTFTGNANSVIKLLIPLNLKIKNSYDISTTIVNSSINMFSNNIIIENLKLNGIFTGNKLKFVGTAKINQFDSDINYEHDVNNSEDEEKGEFLLKIKTKIRGENQKIGIVNLLSGSTLLNLEYRSNKSGQETLEAKANLKDLEFYLDKIAIHKKEGEKANFSLQCDFSKNLQSNIEIKLLGDNNLDILGQIKWADGQYKISLPKIKHKDTNIKANITVDKDNFNAQIYGDLLDLSSVNMMQFLQKQKESVNTNLKIDLDKLKLKNNISIDNVTLQILCDKTQCFSGYLDSKIGDKFLRMLLNNSNNQEQWEITSNDAGAIFKALGLYNKMGSGTMLLILNTKRDIVRSGEIIPIIDGTFIFRDFFISDTSFLTKIVSFISLPGFVNFITNNKNIQFSDMTGKFSYIDNIITISNTSANGNSFDFTMKGSVDTIKHRVQLNGLVTPSIYGINNLVKNLPILGSILSRGHRKGIIIAPYSISQEY